MVGAAVAIASASAQTYDNPWAIGLYGGRTEYAGEYGKNFFKVEENFYWHGALTVERYLNRNFNVGFFGSYGRYGAEKDAQEFEAGLLNLDVNGQYTFPMLQKYKIHPYVFVGVGARDVMDIDKPSKSADQVEAGWDFVVNGGLGIELRLTEHWALRYIGKYGYGFSDAHDKKECGKFDDQQLQHSIGVVYAFATKPRDTDGDGVPDKLDECPDTPAGVSVDEKGCPLDEDGDGVADYLDKCPGTPKEAKVDANGCPIDSDGDGVADYMDECPDTPEAARGKVDAKGCPLDSDGDGVADYLDECPDTPEAARGKVDEKGCPLDTDGDGIADYEDVCPTTPGIKENNGCPEVKAEVKQIFKKALNGIQFESAKATIKKSSYPILNQIVNIMKENPEYKLDIKGHTDNSGKPEKNLVLSDDRANSVRTYLINNGIDESRMTAKGYGDTMPIASNSKPAGRALNRRVEFEVVFSK